ncbi:MAG: hypothetical protein ACWA5A_04970 [Marinibacterium sp.]
MLPTNAKLLLGAALGLTFAVAAVSAARSGFSAPQSRVYQIDANTFEVVGNSGRGARLYWCGAATYARRELGASWQDKVTIARTLGPSAATGRRSAVQFTLTPEALGITPISSPTPNAFAVGDTMTVTSGNGFCRELKIPR